MGGKQSEVGSKEPWRTYLRRKGLKTTLQREAIVDAFLETSGHVNLEELLSRAREKNPGVGLATVYRTVKLLEEAGLALSRQFGSGQTLYEIAVVGEHHDHIICKECGYIVEFESDEIEALQEKIARRHGFEIVQHRHELFGLCDKARGLPEGTCPAERAKKR
ncbi:MAG: transcriptional repressor [Myxococcales bacterium]|nr:transcriptional repressor [Myxococcales bacterium]